ncbi:MAG: histidine phosphatase family protein [Pseudomonadota bacterium]
MTRAQSRTVRWWWVRHAPAKVVEGAPAAFCGWSDPDADLTDTHALGVLRSALPEEAAVLSSDLTRARATADALSRRSHRRLGAAQELREQNFGEWEGQSYDAVDAETFWRDPARVAPPGGESFAEVCARVARAVTARNQHAEEEIVAVAHAGAIRAALALALDMPPGQALLFEIAPLSLTRIDWIAEPGAWRVGGVNLTL